MVNIIKVIGMSLIFFMNLYSAEQNMAGVEKINTILVIIDMQPEFNAANDDVLICNIIGEINKAKNKKQEIFFVEYVNGPKTNERLLEIVSDYMHKVTTIIKHDNGASYYINKVINDKKIINFKLKICGVNTNYCVKDTVSVFSRWSSLVGLKKIVVYGDSCSAEEGLESHENALRYMHFMKKVRTKGTLSKTLPGDLNALYVHLDKFPEDDKLRKIRAQVLYYITENDYETAFKDFEYLNKKFPDDKDILRHKNLLMSALRKKINTSTISN